MRNSFIPVNITVVSLMFCVLSIVHAGNDYFVSTAGNDLQSGLSESNAFATLQHAADLVNAGDTVIVLAGRYVGVRIEASGTPDLPIRFRPQAGARVVLYTKSPAEKRDGVIEIESFSGDGIVSNLVVEGFEVVDSQRYGVDVRSTQFVTVRGLTVSNSFSSGIFTPFCYDITIENNTCTHNGEHGIYHNNSSDRFYIRGNHLYRNTHSGLHMNGDISVPPPDGTPWVQDGILSDGIIENNVIHENGNGGAGINMDGVVRTVLRNNVLYATPNNSGIALFGINGAVASRQNLILNNVVLMALNSGWCLNLGWGAVSNKVYNNIFFHPASAAGSIIIPVAGLEGFECDYNNIKDRFSADGDNSRMDRTQWKALGFDTHSIVATPANLFISHGARNYRLKPNSPAIETGKADAAAKQDKENVTRPLDGDNNGAALWDIGAYEFIHDSANTDGDAHTDAQEQITGTDASDADSVFRITSISKALGQVTLSWPSISGRSYRLREDHQWPLTTITHTNIIATPPTNTVSLSLSATNGWQFRLEAMRPEWR